MRCPRCKSVWVCWNWLEIPDYGWGHECWNCANCWYTKKAIWFGMPYFLLKWLGEYFVEPGRFEKEISKDTQKVFSNLKKKTNDETDNAK